MHWSFLDWLARFLSGLVERQSRSWPTGKSRLDREAQRIEIGCFVLGLVAVGLLVFWVWRG